MFGLDWQWRLFRRDLVKFDSEIHTPGITCKSSVFAPVEIAIFHLDWIYHSRLERTNKVVKYENIKSGTGHRPYYIYEEIDNYDSYFVPVLNESIPKSLADFLSIGL